MNIKLVFSLLVPLLMVAELSFAGENRADENSMFPQKTDSSAVEQIVIGVAEYILFNAIHAKTVGVVPFNDLNIKAKEKFLEDAAKTIQDPNLDSKVKLELAKQIKETEDAIPRMRLNAINAANKAASMSNAIHNISFAGQALVVVDVFGRVYVWNKLDRDPTVSPVATYIMNKFKN